MPEFGVVIAANEKVVVRVQKEVTMQLLPFFFNVVDIFAVCAIIYV